MLCPVLLPGVRVREAVLTCWWIGVSTERISCRVGDQLIGDGFCRVVWMAGGDWEIGDA